MVTLLGRSVHERKKCQHIPDLGMVNITLSDGLVISRTKRWPKEFGDQIEYLPSIEVVNISVSKSWSSLCYYPVLVITQTKRLSTKWWPTFTYNQIWSLLGPKDDQPKDFNIIRNHVWSLLGPNVDQPKDDQHLPWLRVAATNSTWWSTEICKLLGWFFFLPCPGLRCELCGYIRRVEPLVVCWWVLCWWVLGWCVGESWGVGVSPSST